MSGRQPDLFDRAWSAFGDALVEPIRENWRAAGGAAGLVAVLGMLLGFAPAVYLNDMALDIFVPLDGAWRMHHGQWPHLDFYTPIGALYYALLDLAGPGPEAVIRANLLMLPFTAGSTFFLTRNRLPTPLRIGLVTAIALMTISPRTLDSVLNVSHLASYNRHGWTLTAIVMSGVLLEPRERSRRDAAIDAALLTACIVACFYLKVTFFALSGAVLLVVVLFGGPNRIPALAAGVASLLLVGLAFLLTETTPAYLSDLQRTSSAGSDGISLVRFDRFGTIFEGNRPELLTLVAAWVGLIRTSTDQSEENAASIAVLRLLCILGVCFVITSQSHDHAMPVLIVLLVASFSTWRARWETHRGSPLGVHLVGAAAMAFLTSTVAMDTLVILRHTASSLSAETAPLVALPGSPAERIRIPKLPDQGSPLERVLDGTLPHDVYDNIGPPWTRDDDIILRDAVALVDQHGLRGRRIGSLTFSPCFPWMLGAPPPRHLPAWYDFRRTFSAAGAGDIDHTLSDTEVLLVPRVWRIEGIWDVYGPVVSEHFDKVDETALWFMYVRKGAQG